VMVVTTATPAPSRSRGRPSAWGNHVRFAVKPDWRFSKPTLRRLLSFDRSFLVW